MDQQETALVRDDDRHEVSSLLERMMREETACHICTDFSTLRSQSLDSRNHLWRERVAKWCYDVVDHLGESRSMVYLAMSILDRYFALKTANDCILSDRRYEAAALTSLFLAIKIRGSQSLEVTDLIRMSRLGISINEIVEVGKDITSCLCFEHHIFTPIEFVHKLTRYLHNSGNVTSTSPVTESAAFYVELSVLDTSCVGLKASEIALASVLNTLNSSDEEESAAIALINSLPEASFSQEQVTQLRSRLSSLRQGQTSGNSNEPHVIPVIEDDAESVLPVLAGPKRVVSRDDVGGLKRSHSCSSLVDYDTDGECTHASCHLHRTVSPTPERVAKKLRLG
jgi:hypothetical protein